MSAVGVRADSRESGYWANTSFPSSAAYEPTAQYSSAGMMVMKRPVIVGWITPNR